MQDNCVWCECVFRTEVLVFFKKFVSSFFAQWRSEQDELVHCQAADSRVRLQASTLLQNLISLLFSSFSLTCFGFWFELLTSAPGELSSIHLTELLSKPYSWFARQRPLLTGGRFYAKHLRLSQSVGKQSKYRFFKEISSMLTFQILA